MKAPATPFTVLSLELSAPLEAIATQGRPDVLALARWKGRPLGWVWLHSGAADIAPSEIEAAVLRQLEWPLLTASLSPPGADISPLPPISIVVCTRDRPALLERCLTAIARLRYRTYEVIVVDNAPRDGATREVARGKARYVREDRPGLDWARNRGIAEASHDIIAFTDDDATVDPGWLQGLAEGFRDPTVMAVTGLVAPMELETPAQVLFEQVYGGMGKGFRGRLVHRSLMRPAELIAIYTAGVGANMAFRRAAFERVGEFDTALDVGTPSGGGGDLDMFHRVVAAGLPLWYEPRALVWHQHRRTLDELKRQLFNDGRSFGVYLRKLWRQRSVPRPSLLRFAAWQWGRWLVGRVIVGIVGRHRMPVPLLRAGLMGALSSPLAWRATHRNDRRLRQQAPPPPQPEAGLPGVSVIIPAYNARATLAECVESVRSQTHRTWEIVLVDDGSTDGSARLAREYAARDPRITVLSQDHGGVSAARNLGLSRAKYGWVLFLDSDDWITPTHLEQMTAALTADPALDAVHCGWSIADPAGETLEEDFCRPVGDLFPVLARHPAFIIHACVIRKSLVESVGGFDPGFPQIQDWVMWQRVARAGCRFGAVRASLAGYRMQPESVSSAPAAVLKQAIRAIALGHSPDPAVPHPRPEHARGRPAEDIPEAGLAFLGWPAGMMLARGQDARVLLDSVPRHHWPGLATYIGEVIYSAAPRALGRPRSEWSRIWPEVGANVGEFLAALESHTSTPGLGRAVWQDLARRIFTGTAGPFPLTVGRTLGLSLEVTRPFADIPVPPGIERIWCSVELEGKRLGTLELPAAGPAVTRSLLSDAVADRFAWPVLGWFFSRTVYPGGPVDHDADGWDTLLREAWSTEEASVPPVTGEPGRLTIEISGPVPGVEAASERVVEVTAAGVTAGVFTFQPDQLRSPDSLRSAVSDAMGYEFCRVVVREALIGQPLDHRGLRARLQAGMDRPEYSGATVLARHPDLVIGGPGSRRAWYPVEALEALTELARSGGNALVSPETGSPGGIAYAPEVIARSLLMLPPPAGTASGRRYDRHHFEASFARTSDPWSYSSEYERTKYEQTLALLPKGPMARGLELGCAEGHFTELLAPRVDRLVAADISDLALRRAAERCREQGNIEFLRLDLVTDALPGGNDLVVCSEVLYYAGDEPQLADTAARIAGAVRPGGFFLTAHANVAADQPGGTGFDWDVPYGAETIGRTFSGIPDLRLVRELATPLYRIQLYRRTGGPGDATVPPVRQVEPVRALPSPAVARWIRWEPGAGRRPAAEQVVTDRLPVLMYHQVAADGPAARARWRVTPEAFEAQLRYLREAGFHGIRLDDWRAALGLRRPLPGRAVLITFDDGYRDFATVAWPLLKRYGFSAVVFAVSGRVGMTNDWDPGAMGGPELMDWEELRRLRDQGVEIGSHSVSHPRLAHLAPADVVREAALSRATIQRELERPVIAFAYPFGDHDPAIQHLVGACGYDLAFTCFPPGRAAVTGRWLEQSRIEIFGDDDLASFIAKLD